MYFIQTIKDKEELTKLPKNALTSRRIELDDTDHPLLVAYLHFLRKLNGINHRIDVLNESAELIREFKRLYEHSFLFFLLLTGRFDELHQLVQAEHELSGALLSMKKIKHTYAETNRYAICFLHNCEQGIEKAERDLYSQFH